MKSTLDFFLLGQDVMAIVPEFDGVGNLHSLLLLPNGMAKIPLPPKDLVDQTLRAKGTSLRGARDGANYVMERNHNSPVHIYGKPSIILFPTVSPDREDCTWFALHHVKYYEAAGKYATRVTLTNGNLIDTDVSHFSFRSQYQKALTFQFRITENTDANASHVFDPGVNYHLAKGEDGRNFEKKK